MTILFSMRKKSTASAARRSILGLRYFIKRGLKWILGNGKRINFGHNIWLNDNPLINKIIPDRIRDINRDANVSEFIDNEKKRKVDTLTISP